MMKIVLDANVYVSFILAGGETVSSLFHAWKERTFEVLSSEDITAEVKEVCDRFVKRGLITQEAMDETLWRLDQDAKHVKVTSVITRSRDIKDNKYLACAKDGRAHYLVTGDTKHLLSLKTFGATRIVSPKEFVEILRKQL